MRNDHLFPTRIDLSAETRGELVAQLNTHLATLTDLMSQTKHAHWNVKGPNFIGLHKLFDELHEIVEDSADDVAERLTALGGVAHGTVRMAAAASPLEEFPADTFAGNDVVAAMADRYAAAGNSVREGIDAADELEDAGTADLLTDVSRALDKALYFLEAHAEPDAKGERKAVAKSTDNTKAKKPAVAAASA